MQTDHRTLPPAAAALIGCLLALSPSQSLLADSATGTGTSLGDSLSASALASRPLDPDWLQAKHTPTGQMFQFPPALPSWDQLGQAASGWQVSGQIEFGVIGGDAGRRGGRAPGRRRRRGDGRRRGAPEAAAQPGRTPVGTGS